MVTFEMVLSMLTKAANAHNEEIPVGTTCAKINALQERLGIELPADFRLWLSRCNAPNFGSGGVFGISPSDIYMDIEARSDYSETWNQHKWIPIAGDGCGDIYLLDATEAFDGRHPVYFVDQINYDSPAYIVASNLWSFLYFFFETDIGAEYWPVEKDRVLAIDPDLALYNGPYPFCWDEENPVSNDRSNTS